MLTLQELKNMVEGTVVTDRVPTYKMLRETGGSVVAEKNIDTQFGLIVYQNGYVVYKSGKRSTVFPLEVCCGYSYESGREDNFYLREEFFEKENWYLRLILEGEDRIAKNEEWCNSRKQISYSAIAEDWDKLAQEDNALHKMMEREEAEELLQMMTERQRIVVKKYYMEQLREDEIAEQLGITQQAVSDVIQKAIRRVRRKIK